MKKILILSLLFLIAFGLGTFTYLSKQLNSKYSGQDTLFTIKPGQGFSNINYRLKKQGLIQDARIFHYYAKYKNALNSFKAGTYQMKKGMTPQDILETLTKGIPLLTKVTIAEGKNMYEVGKILESKGVTSYKSFIQACKDPNFLKQLNIPAHTVEGYLFPETYNFSPQTEAKEVIKTMVRQFHKKTKNINFQHPSLSKHEIINLASIVEKETGAAWERPTIAGVYLNRLKKPMRLQADPTTIYGIWEKYKGNLRRKHLLEKTDYNTYKMSGLPKGPIANPSLEAIQAVIDPKEHQFLYFVSKNDGTHIFTRTYKEHSEAVNYWQKNRKNRQGKSWRDLKKKN